MHQLVLYSKPGCHLCEIAHQLLLGLRGEFELQLQELDITREAALLQLYGEKIPVVVIDGHTTLYAPIRLEDVRRALHLPY